MRRSTREVLVACRALAKPAAQNVSIPKPKERKSVSKRAVHAHARWGARPVRAPAAQNWLRSDFLSAHTVTSGGSILC
jgi:hypothetical protein